MQKIEINIKAQLNIPNRSKVEIIKSEYGQLLQIDGKQYLAVIEFMEEDGDNGFISVDGDLFDDIRIPNQYIDLSTENSNYKICQK